MQLRLFFSGMILAFSSSFAMAAASPAAMDPNKIIEKADAIRNPSETYFMKIEVETPDNKSVFEVSLKGKDKTMIVTKEPARDLGRNMLMLDRDFHIFVPNLKRTMRLSLSQKLSGQVANGDISRTRWAGDYEPTIEKDEPQQWQIFLKAKRDDLTYAAIRLWVEKNSFKPLKADYLALNGKTILKTATFEVYKAMVGAQRPSVQRIKDPNGQTSTIRVLEMNSKSIEDGFFSTRNLESLR